MARHHPHGSERSIGSAQRCCPSIAETLNPFARSHWANRDVASEVGGDGLTTALHPYDLAAHQPSLTKCRRRVRLPLPISGCPNRKAEDNNPGAASDQDFQALPVQEVQELARRPAGSLVPNLPLTDRRETGIEDRGQHGLAQLVPCAKRTNLRAGAIGYGLQAKRVLALHRPHVDEAGGVEITRRLMRRLENPAAGLGSGCHGKSPSMHRFLRARRAGSI